jgi:hypothetical protein
MHAALERGDDPADALGSTPVGAYLATDQARATEVIFRFHIDDLAGFRRRHGFSLPRRASAPVGRAAPERQ